VHRSRFAASALLRGLATVVLACMLGVGMGAAPQAQQALQRLEIVSGSGTHVFEVEMAVTPAERERGLMYRRYMPKDRGMLFDFGEPQPAAMWMENTYIPLDMLFIRADGVIARIERQAEPLSRRVIVAGEPVLGVLELNGGVCDELGIEAGDKVVAAMFKRGR
jgi:uncharacterized membrane protein (UPF0127 family)